MKNDTIKYGLGGLLVGGFFVWLATSSAINSNNTGMINMMGLGRTTQQSPMQNLNSNSIDAHFIEQMIPHHEDAITMAKLALTKATTVEVKQLAQNIIKSQGEEIDQMKSWYASWFDKDLPTGKSVMNQHGMVRNSNSMHMGMMGDASDITRLENAENFDRAFVEEMIPHHQMAVMMASMLRGGTQRPEMKKLAEDIITAQNSEIDQMRGWLKSW